ncbi:MAG TPA: TolC family protein [Acidobacteriota bacterium]|nr:TolC family protein [Acidobacteriota bacterium]
MSNRLRKFLLIYLLSVAPGLRAQAGPAESIGARATDPDRTLQLSLKQAVDIALSPDGNARVRIAEQLIRQAQARSAQARAALLPNLDASVSQQSQTRNLAAFGIRIQLPIPGFVFPTFVGPFSVFDARAAASQSVFDLSSIRRFQASRSGVTQAEAERESTQDQVVDQVARAYLASLRAQASVDTAKANVDLAEVLLKLANDQKTAGTGTGLEVTRASVQLANEKQGLLVAQNDLTKAHLQLLRLVGLDLSTAVELTERLSYTPVPAVTAQQALQVALECRSDWKAQARREETARLSQSATKLERIPSLNLFADYGSIGSGIDHAIPTRTYGFAVRVPVFDGGRREARRAESSSQFQQERIRTRDLRAQIELEIRLALDSLRSANEQVKTAEEGLALSENELAQAERRYKAGMGSSIEVTDAQTRLERAQGNRILALFNYNVARIDLSTATGTIRQMVQ